MIAHKGYIRPTRAESARITLMLEILDCAACIVEMTIGWPKARPECHHIVEGNRRLGHWYTIPLCAGHHRGAWTTEQRKFLGQGPVALSDGRKLFVARYGTERNMWVWTQLQLNMPLTAWPTSKRVPRDFSLTVKGART
jgi:hypothetical protein